VALPYPEFQNKNVYAARLYTNGYLHHSNVAGVPYTPAGPSPYPACNAGQDDPDSLNWALNALYGKLPDALFTNSTQVEGEEELAFPEGMAYRVTTEGREIVTQVHWLNTTARDVTSEIVYDFFTMPDELVENELAPLAYENREIAVAPRTTADVTSTCAINGATKIVTVLPHAHKRTTHFSIDLLRADGTEENILEDGRFDEDSDIVVFQNPVDVAGFSKLRYSCTVQNDLEVPITWGVGDNEMCMIFGYMFPPSAQQIGVVYEGSTACVVTDVGRFRRGAAE
jgi:hypothetical protein